MNENNWQSRTELYLGAEAMQRLRKAHVLVAGLGGVGGYAVEQLVRAGVGKLTLIDNDVVCHSNRNRQIIALRSTVGMKKTDLVEARMRDINPEVELHLVANFINETNIPQLFDTHYDYVVDAIDTLTPKVTLLKHALEHKVPVVSSMGSGARNDPSLVKVADIKKSNHCPFALKVRKALHKLDIYSGITVVYSPEEMPPHSVLTTDGSNNKRSIVGTLSYMPALFGCYCASVVIRDLIKDNIPPTF